MTLREIERWKLRSGALDRASTACLTIGVFAPLAAAIYATPTTPPNYWLWGASGVSWLFAALILHYLALFGAHYPARYRSVIEFQIIVLIVLPLTISAIGGVAIYLTNRKFDKRDRERQHPAE